MNKFYNIIMNQSPNTTADLFIKSPPSLFFYIDKTTIVVLQLLLNMHT